MSTTATEPAVEPFAGKDAGVACPNCGHPLFSGLAPGSNLVCRAEDGTGCQIAVDPAHLEGQTMSTMATRMEDVVPSPAVGPPNEAPPSTEGPGYEVNTPWEPPTSAPQVANVDPDAPAPVPAAKPAIVPPAAANAAAGTGDGSATAADKTQT